MKVMSGQWLPVKGAPFAVRRSARVACVKAEEVLRESRAVLSQPFFRRSALSPDSKVPHFLNRKEVPRRDGSMEPCAINHLK